MKINILLTLFFAAALFLLAGCAQINPPKACTEEAKLCPDGSYVGRTGPNCEFASCPNATDCKNYSVDTCPSGCVVCPPCAACSSISCQSEEFCSNIGFNRSWYNETQQTLVKIKACTNSGGNVTTQLCCKSVTEFPNTCLIGACGCAPQYSHEVIVCDCGEGKCWDSNKSECINSNA